MQEIALVLAIGVVVSLNLMVLGLLWIVHRTRARDTFEGVQMTTAPGAWGTSESVTERTRWPQKEDTLQGSAAPERP